MKAFHFTADLLMLSVYVSVYVYVDMFACVHMYVGMYVLYVQYVLYTVCICFIVGLTDKKYGGLCVLKWLPVE